MILKNTKYAFKNIITIGVLCSLIVSLGQPIISRADDDFPLPETYVDTTSTDTGLQGDTEVSNVDDFPLPETYVDTTQASDGTDGVLGVTGTDGVPGTPTENNDGIDGRDGLDSPANTVDDLPNDNTGADGASTSSGQPGTNGGSGNTTYRGRAANVFIKTGDASAYASIINYLNTTVIGASNIDIINIYGPAVGTLDFSDFNPNNSVADVSAPNTPVSPFSTIGNSTPALLDIGNDGQLSNNLALNAVSGSNRIVGANGNVIIETGDVDVDASVFNMVNTSLIGKNWKFKVINIFSDLIGDLILPTLESQRSSAGCSGCLQSLNVTNSNSASVGNTINVNGNSGNNSASENGGSATIETGDVKTDASIFNLVDTTVIGDDWYYTQFHVAGDWKGSVYNSNSTAEFLTSGHDVTVRGEDRTAQRDAADAERARLALERRLLNVTTDNNANVQNTITVNADSGNNTADNARGDAIIRTGDVTAKSAITNVVNTTIIGDGWKFYLVNIFGNWKGSAHYGMPDLAVSEVAVPDATPSRRGNKITYVYSYTNGGDTAATDVILRDRFDADKVHVTDASGGTIRGNMITWRIGRLNPRETRVLSYKTTINAPDGSLPVQNEVSIAGNNSDRDMSNNSTGGKVSIALASSSGTSGNGGSTGGSTDGSSSSSSGGSYYSSSSVNNPEYNLVKASDRDTYSIGETIPFTIILDNFKSVSGQAVGVVDQFIGPDDSVVMTKTWDLGEVVGFEHIEITYAIPIPEQAVAGPYSNKVTIYSKNTQGEIMPTVVTNLPITITARKQAEEAPALDVLPNSFLLDMILADDATSTPTSTVDFVATHTKVKRGTKSTDEPIVFGYSSTNSDGGQGPKSNDRASYGFMNSLKMNFGIWLLMTLLGFLLLNIYRYTKKLFLRTTVVKKRINRTPRTRRTTPAIRHRPIAVHVLPLVAPVVHRLSEYLITLETRNQVTKNKISRPRSVGRTPALRSRHRSR